MLVITRRRDEEIVIGPLDAARIEHAGPIVVKVVSVRGDKVRLGIQAAKTLPVHRREIAEKIAAGGRAARRVAPVDDQPGGELRRRVRERRAAGECES